MIWSIIGAASFVAFAVLLWMARGAGKDAAKAKAAEEAIEQIMDAHKPVDYAARERLRRRFRRD